MTTSFLVVVVGCALRIISFWLVVRGSFVVFVGQLLDWIIAFGRRLSYANSI